ncbi:CHAT domain-containing protein [Kibdelosporangium aridum]|uniref:CHAT domain-containing protein n=1 Tax=Kibdelosporangium aridum TaxID=2030 RepID=A0A1W2G0Q7_KIBAR|nr:CHAT domain-containing protein [Kibdelosporangium aridum]
MTVELDPDDPIAKALVRAQAAFARADPSGVDAAYAQAVGLAAGNAGTRRALEVDHVGRLHALAAASLTISRCDEYLAAEPGHHIVRLVRAEAHSSAGDHTSAATDAATIRSSLGDPSLALKPDDHARLLRVEGLAAADRDDLDTAAAKLSAARHLFLLAGNEAGAAAIDRDRVLIAVRLGEEPVPPELLPREPQTVDDYLLLAMSLKRQLRYEEALVMVLRGVVSDDVDRALRLPLLAELVVLLHLTGQRAAAERLSPLLAEAAEDWPDRTAAKEWLARLSFDTPANAPLSPRFGQAVQHARRMIDADRLDEAENLLVHWRDRAGTARDGCTWRLAAGELELARYVRTREVEYRSQAIGQLTEAARQAGENSFAEVQICALRLLGDAHADAGDDDTAMSCWGTAHRLEEEVAALQKITDVVRVGMLLASEDEHDSRIRYAARAVDRLGENAAAAVVVAMEAARGATILSAIVDGGAVRNLPQVNDLSGCQRWLREITRDISRSQLVWMMRPAPDGIHHALIGPGVLHYFATAVATNRLNNAIMQLEAYMSRADMVEQAMNTGVFDKNLAVIADQIGIGSVLGVIPQQVKRIAIVAGRTLSVVPFAAMAIPGTDERIGHRYALSDLPCLSARRPLRLRSLRQRGHDSLLVSPPDSLTPATDMPPHRVTVSDEDATPARLRADLAAKRRHLLRIDSHGKHEPGDPPLSWLQLAPDGPAGRVGASQLRELELRYCGTVVLGACESGMAERLGRDEAVGLVRAAMHAGASSVVAARWIADDKTAAKVLDRFERYIRYLPRDVALQRAQLDVCGDAHPALWACWTLYGDTGWQTSGGPIRRTLAEWKEKRAAPDQGGTAAGLPVLRGRQPGSGQAARQGIQGAWLRSVRRRRQHPAGAGRRDRDQQCLEPVRLLRAAVVRARRRSPLGRTGVDGRACARGQ